MKKDLIAKVVHAGRQAGKILDKMPARDKAKLGETWDVEHAYYSSALEGSKIDKKEFEQLAKQA